MDEEVTLPEDVVYRLNKVMLEELVKRNDSLETLIRLQETELALLWVALLCSVGYTYWTTRRKESNV